VTPEAFGIIPDSVKLTPKARRNLTLITKLLQVPFSFFGKGILFIHFFIFKEFIKWNFIWSEGNLHDSNE